MSNGEWEGENCWVLFFSFHSFWKYSLLIVPKAYSHIVRFFTIHIHNLFNFTPETSSNIIIIFTAFWVEWKETKTKNIEGKSGKKPERRIVLSDTWLPIPNKLTIMIKYWFIVRELLMAFFAFVPSLKCISIKNWIDWMHGLLLILWSICVRVGVMLGTHTSAVFLTVFFGKTHWYHLGRFHYWICRYLSIILILREKWRLLAIFHQLFLKIKLPSSRSLNLNGFRKKRKWSKKCSNQSAFLKLNVLYVFFPY